MTVQAQFDVGLDVGSTTAKTVFLNDDGSAAREAYQRHGTAVIPTVVSFLKEAEKKLGVFHCRLKVTGSAGIGISEKFDLPFIQEVVASTEVIRQRYPQVRTLIDLGGEDAKMIFFEDGRQPDIRMNGSCAGGTGAFIDQMAALQDSSIEEMDELAQRHRSIYPVASRCGVFAKTDVQNLLSGEIPRSDIAASVFYAVAIQSINSLARGQKITPAVMFCGGPLTFIASLRDMFIRCIGCSKNDIVLPELSQHIPAWGAALSINSESRLYTSQELISLLESHRKTCTVAAKRLEPLFSSDEECRNWEKQRRITAVERITAGEIQNGELFLGIDSGSTTTKLTAIDTAGRIVFTHYSSNESQPVHAVESGLDKLKTYLDEHHSDARIVQSAVTGYGEGLIKAAFAVDHGIVETLAHFRAARHCDPDVSFILDIGGQDMKAIFVRGGAVSRIEINEACSSGCGTFIEGFAHSLNHTCTEFARIACEGRSPCDLGTRCTVFMNSRVKQALREDAAQSDIAAGLSYSVINNCLHKVLNLSNINELGDNIVAQGGAFLNDSVFRALEKVTGRPVASTDIPELMGAYGCALHALDQYKKSAQKTSFNGLDPGASHSPASTRTVLCRGCTNNCTVTQLTFSTGRRFHTGNKCERMFQNDGRKVKRGRNMPSIKNHLLFDRKAETSVDTPLTIGIPRILGMYEQYPFWHSLFSNCGINVVLSGRSTDKMYTSSTGTIMADNICFPAKISHGHVLDLIARKVDRIFYPLAIYEKKEHPGAANSYNCPIVSSYAEVLISSIDKLAESGIPFDCPTLRYDDLSLLEDACVHYLKKLGIRKSVIERAFIKAVNEQEKFQSDIARKGKVILDSARRDGRTVVLLAGHPYHVDPLIEQNTSKMLSDLGADVITVDTVQNLPTAGLKSVGVIPQWTYPNRILHAAQWLAEENDDNLHCVMLTSFGCGPDVLVIDEVKELLEAKGKFLTLIKIDEMSSPGSTKLRLRSLIESARHRQAGEHADVKPIRRTPAFTKKDISKTILAPHFSEYYSPFLESILKPFGYNLICLPPSDVESARYGLQYSNNELCYPATVVIGDIIKALKSGKYDPDNIAVVMSQTGGQCRATNYITQIKKALLRAGFDNVNVISAAPGDAMINEQSGIDIDAKRLFIPALVSMLYAEAISQMYLAVAARESRKGDAARLKQQYLRKPLPYVEKLDIRGILNTLHEACDAFNRIQCMNIEPPKIGVVGEIFLKYNSFSHLNVLNWMVEQGVEVFMPHMLDFFVQYFVNVKVECKEHLSRNRKKAISSMLYEPYFNRHARTVDRIMEKFRFHRPEQNIHKKAKEASKIIGLANAFGEGWLIPAEIADYARMGINNVVCLQPFGCISNHIVAKGIEKKIKKFYSAMNMLFLDFEADTSEVNVQNRLYFMIKNAFGYTENRKPCTTKLSTAGISA